ncbi:right-handed parallel beta-helix repeat-containing protein [Mucilaginibacter straminoryzae]|uniref:right-handed parallel beta-helix repeat-containing protein n=1 Tax=Mucilaginibacter straminoryzae TaxID=2932774 RepID=UPI001FD6E39B|nr:right-handed parallel beta-helix repeat-containing protein [Mucilaginibacter straminoryzae]
MLLAVVLGLTRVQAADIWISPLGNDANAGTKESPMRTVAKALRKAREMRRLKDSTIASGIHIILKQGEYVLEEPLRILPEDSGTEQAPTWIECEQGANAAISGGLNIAGWQLLKQPVKGLPNTAKGKVWVADAPRIAGNQILFRQLWVNGNKAIRARSVNNWEKMPRIISLDKQKEEMVISSSALPLGDYVQLEMVIHQMWAIANLRVKTVAKQGEQTKLTFYQPESHIEFEHPWPSAVIDKDGKMNGNSPFYLTNSLAFLDTPGEWFEDMQTGKVYYWPRKGEDMSKATVNVPVLENLVEIKGTAERQVSNVHFKGITFEYATWLRPSLQGHVPLQSGMYLLDAYKLKVPGTPEKPKLENQAWVGRPPAAVQVSYANHTSFNNCTFRHLASAGLDYLKYTHDDEISGNLFKDIGGSAIQAGVFSEEGYEAHLPYNPADVNEFVTKLNINNNLVNDVTNEDWGCLGISAGFVKNINISHNEVCEVGYTGISVGWGWTKAANVMSNNIIRANKIHHYARHLYDVAGIYTLSAQPGTMITENEVDSIYKVSYAHDPHHWFYLYTDEGSSGITVKDNWTPAEKYLKNANGPGNVWENNGPTVSNTIRQNAGLEPQFRYLLKNVEVNNDNQPINHAEKEEQQ